MPSCDVWVVSIPTIISCWFIVDTVEDKVDASNDHIVFDTTGSTSTEEATNNDQINSSSVDEPSIVSVPQKSNSESKSNSIIQDVSKEITIGKIITIIEENDSKKTKLITENKKQTLSEKKIYNREFLLYILDGWPLPGRCRLKSPLRLRRITCAQCGSNQSCVKNINGDIKKNTDNK